MDRSSSRSDGKADKFVLNSRLSAIFTFSSMPSKEALPYQPSPLLHPRERHTIEMAVSFDKFSDIRMASYILTSRIAVFGYLPSERLC